MRLTHKLGNSHFHQTPPRFSPELHAKANKFCTHARFPSGPPSAISPTRPTRSYTGALFEDSKSSLILVSNTRLRCQAVLRADTPTWFERACSALMFLLPLSEGLYRIAIITLKFCKGHALEFLFWCHLQLRQVSLALSSRTATDYTREDVMALETLMQMAQQIHAWFSDWFEKLVNLSLPICTGKGDSTLVSWVSSTFTSPEAVWHLICLSTMSLLATFAGVGSQKRLSKASSENAQSPQRFALFRKPEVVLVSYFCAVLLRVAWVPLQGMSDLSLGLYSVGASLVTIITTGSALVQVHKLLFSKLAKLARCLEGMVGQVTNVAQLHRSLLMLDWILCLFSKQSTESKSLHSLMLMIYWMTVTALEKEADSSRHKPFDGHVH